MCRKRHFLWGAGRSRVELEPFELLAHSLAEALRLPQTKPCVKRKLLRETVRLLFVVLHLPCSRPSRMWIECMSAVNRALGVSALR